MKNCIETYKLPSHWASFLINGDTSGTDEEELTDIKAFCRRNGLPLSAASYEPAGFCWKHDAMPECDLAGDCEEFTFILPYVPFLIRKRYYQDSKQWELQAVFPTFPASSSNWYDMEAIAENGDNFACTPEAYNATRNIRGFDVAAVADFEKRVRRIWEKDDDFPCRLMRYERIQPAHNRQRETEWRKGRC